MESICSREKSTLQKVVLLIYTFSRIQHTSKTLKIMTPVTLTTQNHVKNLEK
jgi:hypothetical protein